MSRLHALAYNLANFMRTLALPEAVKRVGGATPAQAGKDGKHRNAAKPHRLIPQRGKARCLVAGCPAIVGLLAFQGGLARVNALFIFARAAYDLVRLPRLLEPPA